MAANQARRAGLVVRADEAVTERPILFGAPMVRAILGGTKTQTRRVVKPCKDRDIGCELSCCELAGEVNGGEFRNAYCEPGDRLWVREAFIHEPADYCWEASVSIPCRPASTVYRADQEGDTRGAGWKSSIHMPRSLSRITLEVTGVRIERLRDISEADAIAEGVHSDPRCRGDDDAAGFHRIGAVRDDSFPIARYAVLWESINGPGSWDQNPWVWVIEFKRTDT